MVRQGEIGGMDRPDAEAAAEDRPRLKDGRPVSSAIVAVLVVHGGSGEKPGVLTAGGAGGIRTHSARGTWVTARPDSPSVGAAP